MIEQKFFAAQDRPINILKDLPVLRFRDLFKRSEQFAPFNIFRISRQGVQVKILDDFCIGHLLIKEFRHPAVFCRKLLVNRIAVGEVQHLTDARLECPLARARLFALRPSERFKEVRIGLGVRQLQRAKAEWVFFAKARVGIATVHGKLRGHFGNGSDGIVQDLGD